MFEHSLVSQHSHANSASVRRHRSHVAPLFRLWVPSVMVYVPISLRTAYMPLYSSNFTSLSILSPPPYHIMTLLKRYYHNHFGPPIHPHTLATHPPNHPPIYSPTKPPTYPLNHPPTHPPINSTTHLPTHPLSHPTTHPSLNHPPIHPNHLSTLFK